MQSFEFAKKIDGFDLAAALEAAHKDGARIEDGENGLKIVSFNDGSKTHLKPTALQVTAYDHEGIEQRYTRRFVEIATGRLVDKQRVLTSATVEFCPQGGGFLQKLSLDDFNARFAPAPKPVFAPVNISGDWIPEDVVIPAYSNGLVWNGWAKPHFTFETAQSLMGTHIKDMVYDAERDVFVIKCEGEEDLEAPAEEIEVDGQKIKTYAVGAGCWCWYEAPETPAEQLAPTSPG